jgi:hypothetical protein
MPKTTNPLRRQGSATNPFASARRTKPIVRAAAKGESAPRLDDVGLISCLAKGNIPQDVAGLICHVRNHTFEDVPDRAAGMSSTRIAELLQFRRALPPIVSVAHLHALSSSTTRTERELALLTARGVIRKIVIPGRGKGGAAVGEGVALVEDWKQRLREESSIEDETKKKYFFLMDANPTSSTVPIATLSPKEVRSLVVAGFLTNPAALTSSLGALFTQPTGSSLHKVASAGHSAATGTLAAVGGFGAVHDNGGGGSTLATSDRRRLPPSTQQEMTLALPSTGAYLNLLVTARAHLLHLLRQLSPRHKEALRSHLKEKWDGNTPADAVSVAKRARGEFFGVLSGKTKHWREFHGLEFDWVLAECVGSGLVELFNTSSVGVGVRTR